MEKEKIDRINALAALSRERELTDSEKREQADLRLEYLEYFRRAIRGNIEPQNKKQEKK